MHIASELSREMTGIVVFKLWTTYCCNVATVPLFPISP